MVNGKLKIYKYSVEILASSTEVEFNYSPECFMEFRVEMNRNLDDESTFWSYLVDGLINQGDSHFGVQVTNLETKKVVYEDDCELSNKYISSELKDILNGGENF